MSELETLRYELKLIAQQIAPWIGQDEMQSRYNVTGRTLLEMEKRGDIPVRVKGRWLRTEVMDLEGARR